ncbi:adp-glucose phosphorylase [Anaeramoeba ignava]|uniref:Adp-glucose phosphorylase n=1 Tax=Anaeramoeba ignava TaxID=1746090 RepID=A0A9Q0LQG6_ANAIG|nr:adp-glucose phosphorylase [Anaeramoeba ignava]
MENQNQNQNQNENNNKNENQNQNENQNENNNKNQNENQNEDLYELRKDYFFERYVIVSTERERRPLPNKRRIIRTETKNNKKIDEECVFCVGNEHLTSKETYRLEDQNDPKKWKIRIVLNKYPAIKTIENTKEDQNGIVYTTKKPIGTHEVIIETTDHSQQIDEFSVDQMEELVHVYCLRLKELYEPKEVKYVSLFKNAGPGSGASQPHAHSQIVSMNLIPPIIKEKMDAFEKHPNGYVQVVEQEKNSQRFCYGNDSFVLITPFASFYRCQALILPITKIPSMIELTKPQKRDLADVLVQAYQGLRDLQTPYNVIFHNAPKNCKNFHFHVDIIPRMSSFAGFEYGTGFSISSFIPEVAAQYFRKKDEK